MVDYCPWGRKESGTTERLTHTHTHSSILAGEFHGLYSPWGSKESDMTEAAQHACTLCMYQSQSSNLSPSLENPKDGGAWWAAVYGVTQSWTRLK